MSISRLVSVYNVLNEFIEDTGLADLNMQHTLIRWCIKADRAVGAFHQYQYKKAKIKIEDCKFTLPCDLVALLPGMAVTSSAECDSTVLDSTDNFVINHYSRFYGTYSPGTGMMFLMDAGTPDHGTHCGIEYKLINDKIQLFTSQYNDKYMYIRYLGYEYDCNGFPLIRESNSDACTYYLQMKLGEKGRWTKGVLNITENQIDKITARYRFHVAKARASAGTPTPEERQEMINMINSPFMGIRNAHWAYRDYYWNNAAA